MFIIEHYDLQHSMQHALSCMQKKFLKTFSTKNSKKIFLHMKFLTLKIVKFYFSIILYNEIRLLELGRSSSLFPFARWKYDLDC